MTSDAALNTWKLLEEPAVHRCENCVYGASYIEWINMSGKTTDTPRPRVCAICAQGFGPVEDKTEINNWEWDGKTNQ